MAERIDPRKQIRDWSGRVTDFFKGGSFAPIPDLEWVDVDSTMVSSIKYEIKKELLYIRYKSDRSVWTYAPVPVITVYQLLGGIGFGGSIGKYMNQYIRFSSYDRNRIDPSTI